MPAVIGMTLEEAISEVLVRVGQLDEDVSNPTLDAEAQRHINAAQRQLEVEHDWLRKQQSADLVFAAGQRFADLPADARHQQIQTAWWVDGDSRMPMTPGIDRYDQHGGTETYPWCYDVTPTTGIVRVTVTDGGTGYTNGSAVVVSGGTRSGDGHDPEFTMTTDGGIITAVTVTNSGSRWTTAPTLTPADGSAAVLAPVLGAVQVVEILPAPTNGGTLEITYRAKVVKLTELTDQLALDDEAVIGRAAWLLATIKKMSFADTLLKSHVAYLDSLRRQVKPGAIVSMSDWRAKRQRPTAMADRRGWWVR